MMEKQNIWYITAAVVVIIIVAVVMVQKPAETPETSETSMAEPEDESSDVTEITPEPTEEPEVSETGEIDYGTRGILSDVKCSDGKMSAIITNVQDETMNIEPNTYETDIRITVNGIVSKWFVCDKTELAPGEYAYCDDLLGPMSDRLTNDDQNKLSVWFLSDTNNRGTVTDITCSGSTEQDDIDAPYNP